MARLPRRYAFLLALVLVVPAWLVAEQRPAPTPQTAALSDSIPVAKYYEQLTPASIQQAAKTYLNRQDHVKVVLMPEKKINGPSRSWRVTRRPAGAAMPSRAWHQLP